MLLAADGGLQGVFARHQRWAEGVRAAVKAWGLEVQCADPASQSPVLTGVIMPEGVDADAVRKLIYERFDLSLGTGLGKVKGRMFRIGHLGDCNDLTLMAALGGLRDGPEAVGRPLAGIGRRRRPWSSSPGHPRLARRRPPEGGVTAGTPIPLRRETTCNAEPS